MITRPLADRMRPETFADVFGDEKLFSDGGIFPKMIETGHIPNMIFYGPSGTGKRPRRTFFQRRREKLCAG